MSLLYYYNLPLTTTHANGKSGKKSESKKKKKKKRSKVSPTHYDPRSFYTSYQWCTQVCVCIYKSTHVNVNIVSIILLLFFRCEQSESAPLGNAIRKRHPKQWTNFSLRPERNIFFTKKLPTKKNLSFASFVLLIFFSEGKLKEWT